LRVIDRVLLAALLAAVAGLALAPLTESDVFFRLRAGQEILARHALPGRNLFSFTAPDHPDVDTAWLFEVGAALLFRAGGFPALVVGKAAVLVATFAGAFALCRRRGAGPVAAAVALAAAAIVARERFVERPHLFSLAGEVALLWLVEALDVAADDRVRRRLVAAGLAVVVLWANLHAGVFLAPVILALAGRPRLAAAAALATLATPVGVGLVTYLRLHLAIPALHPVDEFRAATWVSDAPLFVYLAAVVVAGALARPRVARALLPAAALGVLALRSVRFGADFALVAAPVLAVGLERLVAKLRGPLPAVAVAAALAGWTLAPRVADARRGRPALDLGLDTSIVPLDAIRFATDHGLRGRMYNDFEIGSYLAFERPHRPVFVDPRLPAYPLDLHALLGRADLSRAEWDAAMERYGVDAALLAYAGLNRRVAWWDPARWALVYRERDARVFVRRGPRHDALVAEREIPATFSFTAAEGATTLPLAERPAASPVPDCEWQRRLGDLLFELDGAPSPRMRAAYDRALAATPGCLAAAREARLAAWLGALELGARRFDAAERLLARALERGDADLTTRANRALAAEGAGRRDDARAAWTDVAARAGGTPLADVAAKRLAALSAP
jgi:hypothetical protein